MTTEDEVRLLELQLADIKRQIAYHEGALQDLWMQLTVLLALLANPLVFQQAIIP